MLRLARDFLVRSHPIFSMLGWCAVAAIVALSIMPASERPMTGAGRGFEHLAAFAMAAALFAVGNAVSTRRLALYAVAACVLVEVLQVPLPTRHARLSDVVLDATASVLAIGLVAGLRWLLGRQMS